MEIKMGLRNCYYEVGQHKICVGAVFESVQNGKWTAYSYESDYFSKSQFDTKEDALKHIDETMKDIFKRILDE